MSFIRPLSYPFPLYQPQPLQFSIEMQLLEIIPQDSVPSGIHIPFRRLMIIVTWSHCLRQASGPEWSWWSPPIFPKIFFFPRSLSSPLINSKPQNFKMKEWDGKRDETSNKGAPIIGPPPIFHTQLRSKRFCKLCTMCLLQLSKVCRRFWAPEGTEALMMFINWLARFHKFHWIF